jgi:lactoylglutathione lyase
VTTKALRLIGIGPSGTGGRGGRPGKLARMRSFPVVYVRDVARSLEFYARRLGFEEQYRFPPDADPPGYVSLRSDSSELGLVHESSPLELIGTGIGDGPRYELFVYVDDVDAVAETLTAAGAELLRAPGDMPWGERIGIVADPDGNPVTLAAPAQS